MGSELRVMCCRIEGNGWGKRGEITWVGGGRWEEEREIKGKRGGVVKSNLGAEKKGGEKKENYQLLHP